MKTRGRFKKWINLTTEDLASGLGGALAAEQVFKNLPPFLQNSVPQFQELTNQASAILLSTEFGQMLATWNVQQDFVAAGLITAMIVACRCKARRKADQIQADHSEQIADVLSAMHQFYDLRTKDFEKLENTLTKNREALTTLIKQVNADMPNFEGIDEWITEVGLDVQLLVKTADALHARMILLAKQQDDLKETCEDILDAVCQAPTLKELEARLAPILTNLERQNSQLTEILSLLKPTFETKLGLFIPRPAVGTNTDYQMLQRLQFAERLVPELVGRDGLNAEFEQFLNAQQPDNANQPIFRWVALTGYGGSGKSRFALELLLRHQLDWYVGFVDKEGRAARLQNFQTSDLPTDRPTLLIIDYLQADAKDIAAFLKKLGSAHLQQHVRVILVDRIFTNYWFDREIMASARSFAYSTGNEKPHEIRIEPLEYLDFQTVFKNAYQAVAAEPPGQKHLETLAQAFKEKKNDRLPLFAVAAALYVHSRGEGDQTPTEWTTDEIKHYFLHRTFQSDRPQDEIQMALHEIYLSTLLGGFDQARLQEIGGLDQAIVDGGVRELSNTFLCAERPDKDALPPLEPDPLGEFYVAERVQNRAFVGNDRAPIGNKSCELLEKILDLPAEKLEPAIEALTRILPRLLKTPASDRIVMKWKNLPIKLKLPIAAAASVSQLDKVVQLVKPGERKLLLTNQKTAIQDEVKTSLERPGWDASLLQTAKTRIVNPH